MDRLTKRAWTGVLWWQIALAALIFGPASSLTYWQGWLCWLVYLAGTLTITRYFLRHDPALIERRLKAGPTAERRSSQKLIQLLAAIAICAVFIVSAFDHRFHWSSVPLPFVLAGAALVVVGFMICFLVFRANPFAAAIIEVGAGQKVAASGPYALVRHPMYAGALLMFLGTPIALGSWWGLLPAGLLAAVIVWRLLDEEEYLRANLPGYEEYRRKVRFRLVPWVW